MDSQNVKLIIAICLLVPFLVVLNLGLWTALRRRNAPNQTRMIQKARTSINHPWESEDQQLKELSDRVAGLKGHPHREEPSQIPDEKPASGESGPGQRS